MRGTVTVLRLRMRMQARLHMHPRPLALRSVLRRRLFAPEQAGQHPRELVQGGDSEIGALDRLRPADDAREHADGFRPRNVSRRVVTE